MTSVHVDDAETLRYAAEAQHRAELRSSFDYPFLLSHATKAGQLTLKECHKFCWKACAIYCSVRMHSQPQRDIFNLVYDKWFRGSASNIEFENFFAKLIGCWYPTSPRTVPDIVEAHRTLCAEVSRRQRVLCDQDSNAERQFGDCIDDHAEFELQPIFRAVLIIVDCEEWQEKGVVLVRTGDSTGLELGPVDFAPLQTDFQDEGNGINQLRIPLDRAIDFVMNVQQREEDAKVAV